MGSPELSIKHRQQRRQGRHATTIDLLWCDELPSRLIDCRTRPRVATLSKGIERSLELAELGEGHDEAWVASGLGTGVKELRLPLHRDVDLWKKGGSQLLHIEIGSRVLLTCCPWSPRANHRSLPIMLDGTGSCSEEGKNGVDRPICQLLGSSPHPRTRTHGFGDSFLRRSNIKGRTMRPTQTKNLAIELVRELERVVGEAVGLPGFRSDGQIAVLDSDDHIAAEERW